MIVFRPMPRLTAATLSALALLLALGVWQLNRAQEKRKLIAEHAKAESAAPFDDLYTPVCRGHVSAENAVGGATVKPPTVFKGEEVRFYGPGPGGEGGWRILRLTPAPDCGCPEPHDAACVRQDLSVVTEVGFEGLDGTRSGPAERLQIAPPPTPNLFTPQNDPERGQFYRFDEAALARAFGVAPKQVEGSWWLAADRPGLPPALAEMPPERHIGYALTWFGMAIALIAIYFVYHHRAGRLGREL
jgi:surfeit locus 1 family protein